MRDAMKILYVSDRGAGGIANHVKCLVECLPADVEHYAIGIDEPFAGRNGHDWREWFQIRRVVKRFLPDVIHFHAPCLLMALYARLFSRAKLVCSWHVPTNGKRRRGERLFLKILGKGCYYLPVGCATWKGLQRWMPGIRGEVFYNPLKIGTGMPQGKMVRVIGMVGRNADVKDWPSFHRVAELVGCEAWNVGEKDFCLDGRAKIGQMTVYVLTSKREAMPTAVLEAFAEKTAICGFIPEGGMSEILSYSEGPLKSAFLKERDCEKLAGIVKRLLDDETLRKALISDGWNIVTRYFDAEKNCRGQLMEIYRRVIGEGTTD